MVKKKHKTLFRERTYGMRPVDNAIDVLLERLGGKEARQLAALWDNWAMVLGEDMAPLGFPIGHKDATLLIGAEDSMAMQELFMQSAEILERANAFMDSNFFERVRVVLLQGKRPLNEKRSVRPRHRLRRANPPRPPRLGGLQLPPDSPVAECYKAYIAAFE